MSDSDGRIVIDIVTELTKLQGELSEAVSKVDKAAKQMEGSIDGIGKEAEKATTKTSTFGDMLKAKLTGDVIMKGLEKLGKLISDIGKATITSGVQFESAFAGVEKTVDGTTQELEGLRSGIRDMALEIPATANAIAGVAEAAGQLGIQNANIMGFTETMIGLGEATDVSAQQAATSLAQFANVTGMLQTDFDRLGSVIVDLGNNFATTESSIIAMGQRLAGAGSQVGMSEASIMGFSAALASVGIEAEMGGSAFSKMMNMIDKSAAHGEVAVKKFSDVANMSGADFIKLWEEDAAGAMVKFIEGLGEVQEAGGNLNLVLEDIGVTEIRMSDALRRAAGASDLFAKAVADGNFAWEENIALQTEVEKRYATTESQMQLAKNALNEMGITISQELLPEIVELSQKFVEFVQDNKDDFVDFGKAVTGVFGFVIDNAGAVATGITGIGIAIAAVKVGLTALAGPIGWATAAITALVGVVGYFKNEAKEAAKAQEEFRQELINSGEILEDLQGKTNQANENLKVGNDVIKSYKELKAAIDDTSLSVEEKAAKQDELAIAEQTLIDLSDGLITKADLESGAIERLLPLLSEQLGLKRDMAQWEEDIFVKTHSKERVMEEISAMEARREALRADYNLVGDHIGKINDLTWEAQKEFKEFGAVSEGTAQALGKAYEAAGIGAGEAVTSIKAVNYRADMLNTAFRETGEAVETLNIEIGDAYKSLSILVNHEAKEAIEEMDKAFESGALTVEEYKIKCEELGIALESTKTGAKILAEELAAGEKPVITITGRYGGLISQLSQAKTDTDLLAKASETLTDGMLLEEHQVDALIAKFPELAEYIKKTGDTTFDNGKKIIEVQDSIAISSEAMRLAAIKRAETELAASEKVIKAYEEERKAAVALMQTKGISAGIMASELDALDANFEAAQRRAKEAREALAAMQEIGPISASAVSGAFSSAGGSASKAMSEAEKSAEEAAKKIE